MKLVYPAIALDHSNPVTNSNQIGNYLIKAFNQHGVESEIIYYRNDYIKYLYGFNKIFYQYIKKQNYIVSREPKFLEYLTRKINDKINQSDADFVFAFGTNPVAFLETNKPIYILSDSTFNNLLNRYGEYFNLPKRFIENTNLLEKTAFQKAKKIFLSSKFAIDDAINFYGIAPEKIVQVPLGANIDTYPDENQIHNIIDEKLSKPLNLLMIGKDWHRKGIDIGIEIYKNVNAKINKANLTIIGCKSPIEIIEPGIQIIENINKANKEEFELFQKIMYQTHIFLFPSRAEAYGHVISEANAFGIPVIANNIGGIPSAIDNGINGYLFDLNNTIGIEFAVNKIIELYDNQTLYKKLSLNSYKTYSSKSNWNSIVKLILMNIEKSLKE